MKLRSSLLFLSTLSVVALSPASSNAEEDPLGFVQHQHAKLDHLLHDAVSAARDAQINQALDGFVDYSELTRRAFGEPCPPAIPSCEDLWAKYVDGQKEELSTLLTQLVRKSYRKNLTKTLDYEIAYRGSREAEGDTRVQTEAKNKTKPRDPAVRIDYVVKRTQTGYRVVDIITEGSSLTKNYYDQFRKKMSDPSEGYDNIVLKLREKIAKAD